MTTKDQISDPRSEIRPQPLKWSYLGPFWGWYFDPPKHHIPSMIIPMMASPYEKPNMGYRMDNGEFNPHKPLQKGSKMGPKRGHFRGLGLDLGVWGPKWGHFRTPFWEVGYHVLITITSHDPPCGGVHVHQASIWGMGC